MLFFFKNVNAEIKSGFPILRMKEETSEHLHMLFNVLKYVIFPASICYVFIGAFLGENTLDSIAYGVVVFVYGCFLPDLPSAFRQNKVDANVQGLSWYKEYALLLLAPIFIWLLFSDIGVTWKTAETFHNFRSLLVFEGFLALFGVIVFGGLLEPLTFSLYGAIGYLAHLKVDKIW